MAPSSISKSESHKITLHNATVTNTVIVIAVVVVFVLQLLLPQPIVWCNLSCLVCSLSTRSSLLRNICCKYYCRSLYILLIPGKSRTSSCHPLLDLSMFHLHKQAAFGKQGELLPLAKSPPELLASKRGSPRYGMVPATTMSMLPT
jgi:hypothetical protein